MSNFIDQLRYADAGFAIWHSNAVRYQEYNVIEGDLLLKVVVSKKD